MRERVRERRERDRARSLKPRADSSDRRNFETLNSRAKVCAYVDDRTNRSVRIRDPGRPLHSPFSQRPTPTVYHPYKTGNPSISTSARHNSEKSQIHVERKYARVTFTYKPDPEDIFLRHAHRGNQLAKKTCPCPVLSPLSSYTYTSASVGRTRGVGFPAETFESIYY